MGTMQVAGLFGRLGTLVFGVLLALGVALPAGASDEEGADIPGIVLITAEDVEMTGAANGTATATIEIQNSTSEDLDVDFNPAGEKCQLDETGDEWVLESGREQSFDLTFLTGCDTDQEGAVDVTILLDQAEFKTVSVAKPSGSFAWNAVVEWYVWAAIGAFIVLVVAWVWAFFGEHTVAMTLPGLAADWKFTDSWATNATVVTALFTGIFGAKDVVAVVVGEGVSALLSTALVTSALSVGLAGLSPLVLQSLRRRKDDKYCVTAAGLLAAALLTLTATGGQLLALLNGLQQTDLRGGMITSAGAVGIFLLALYGLMATRQNLILGSIEPPADKTQTTMQQQDVPGSLSVAVVAPVALPAALL